MSNHRKLREAPSERPAGFDPSPSEDGLGNSQDGAKETRTDGIRQLVEDMVDFEMRKWNALPYLIDGWSLDADECVQEGRIAALFEDIDSQLGQAANKSEVWMQVFHQYPHAIETVYETAKATGLTARDLSQIPVTRWYYLTPYAVILMKGAKEPRTGHTREEA